MRAPCGVMHGKTSSVFHKDLGPLKASTEAASLFGLQSKGYAARLLAMAAPAPMKARMAAET